MQLTKIPFRQTRSFSDFFLDYIQQKETLKPFYNQFPTVDNFASQLQEKRESFSQKNRDVLVNTLLQQYKEISAPEQVSINIQSLKKETTFTVTTGHQLNVFTGPLYFIYKIVTVINACKILKQKYPAYNFVPVYWMASEDHDYEEIKSFRLYGKKYTWNTDQKGAVGRFTTQGFKELLNEIPGNNIELFRNAYLKNKTLADAVRSYVNALLGSEGVVVIDADSRELKSLFADVMKEDIIRNSVHKTVEETNKKLEVAGYETQVHCREINFFYLDNQLRSRIEKKGDRYEVIDTDIAFTESELLKAIEQTPEKFSPNVILRPLYQETILPNLAYVGGPAEVVYWLQLKKVFEHHNVPFPMLMPRNFALVVDTNSARKIEKTGMSVSDFFLDKHTLFNHWVIKNSNQMLTVDSEHAAIDKLFQSLKQKSEKIDKTLVAHVSAVSKRTIDNLENIGKKLLRAEKRRHDEKLKQLEAVKDALFPNGSLQERTDNFLNFYQTDSAFIDKLIRCFDPFDFQFNVLQYE